MTRQTRREFLENSMFAATLAATAGSAWQSTTAMAQGSSSPNERRRVAVIGVSGRGQSHIGAFVGRNDTEVSILCDVDEKVGNQRVEAWNKKGAKARYVKDLREIMDDESIDVVSIATPNHWHALAAIWAVQAGKDVYVEKPVSHNVSEGRRIVQAARKYDRIVQTGTQCRSMGGSRQAIEFIEAGKIGEVKLARGLCYKPRGSIGAPGKYEVPPEIDYNLWLGPAPEKPLTRPRLHYDWHWMWDYGNGDLGNQGIHQMDIARWGLGVSGLGSSVVSYGGRLGYKDAGETANTQVSIHSYGDKTLVFEVRGLKTDSLKGAKVGVIFEGSEGYLVLTSYTSGAAFDRDGNMIEKFNEGGDHFANFITACNSRDITDLNADIEEGHYSSGLCHLGNISYRLGTEMSVTDLGKNLPQTDEASETLERVVNHLKDNGVDPNESQLALGPLLTLDGEGFTGTGAREATPMLTREYRKPFVVPSASDV